MSLNGLWFILHCSSLGRRKNENQPTDSRYQESTLCVALRLKWHICVCRYFQSITFETLMDSFSYNVCRDAILFHFLLNMIFIHSRPKYLIVVVATSGAIDAYFRLFSFEFFNLLCLTCLKDTWELSVFSRHCVSQLMHITAASSLYKGD